MNALQKAMQITSGLGTRQCIAYREKIFVRNLPIAVPLALRYKRTAKAKSYVVANKELRDADDFLTMGERGNRINVYIDDDELRDFCEFKGDIIKRRFYRSIGQIDRVSRVVRKAIASCVQELGRYGLEFPCENWREADEVQLSQAMARVFDPDWWRRCIRQRQNELIEAMCIKLGLVNRDKGIYASNLMVYRKRAQRRRNEFMMKRVEMENEQGQVFNLHDLYLTSVSNPVNRRNELMTRISGFEQLAKELGLVGVFITLTAPSKYHASLSKPCVRNPRFGGYTPKQTQDYLNTVWKRTRAAYKRKGISPFGFRVVEPHHDSTPHWHMLFFIDPQHKDEMIQILRSYALQEAPDEKGAQEHRLKVVDIDATKGSAAGYIAKYISKNIDGYKVGADLDGNDAIESAERITAWASTWRIRQFQQIGGASVTVWRELRRLNGCVPESVRKAIGDDLKRFEELVEAADKGDWKQFTVLMGGVSVKRADQFLRACYLIKEDGGKYKETVNKLLGVLMSGFKTVITRHSTWIVRMIPMIGTKRNIIQSKRDLLIPDRRHSPPLEFCQ